MKKTEFDNVIERKLTQCEDILTQKGKEYAPGAIDESDIDRLETFKIAATLQGITSKQALCGMMTKHIVSIYQMCAGGEFSPEKWDEKITDAINYMLILRAIVEEERNLL